MSLRRVPLKRTFSVPEQTWLSPDTVPLIHQYILTPGMYAASANLVLTTGTGNGVNGFTLDNALGEFILTHPNVPPPQPPIFKDLS